MYGVKSRPFGLGMMTRGLIEAWLSSINGPDKGMRFPDVAWSVLNSMNLFQHFRDEVVGIVNQLAGEGRLPNDLETARIAVEPPREATHGDITTNAAMVLAKAAGMPPRDLAGMLTEQLDGVEWISDTDIAGPGFINMRLKSVFWHGRL